MRHHFKSEIGWITLEEKKGFLTGVFFGKQATPCSHRTDILPEAENQILEYLSNKREVFDLPIRMSHGTKFQQKVWSQIKKVKYGTTLTYSELAVASGSPLACRSVGSAAKNNPLPLIIPCHRIVGKSGNLSNYVAGMKIKHFLLRLEGHSVGE